VLFVDLRDHYGITQIVADSDSPALAMLEGLRVESVVTIDGDGEGAQRRDRQPEPADGRDRSLCRAATVLSRAEELPLPVAGEQEYPEDIRLKYRFLDLRRETLHANIMKRTQSSRNAPADGRYRLHRIFDADPDRLLSPEGARDFLVPSRIHPGKFFALPQAPQQYKQLLMVAGFDRYFQIAPCFRDEDPRADRLPGEFYQLDLEMSFVTQEEVWETMEPVMAGIFESFADGKAGDAAGEFPRIPYAQAMLEIRHRQAGPAQPADHQDVTEHFTQSGFGSCSRRSSAAAASCA
jgi:aspartyl-tRNA synthetase